MHDSTGDSDEMRAQNRTYDFTRLLIPILQRMGYNFVRLDEIPEIITAAERPLIGGLKASNGLFVSAQSGGGGEIYVNGLRFDSWERIEVQYIAPGKVALKAPNGQFYSAQNGGSGLVLANGPRISNWERFDAIPVGPEGVAFRTHQGKYLTRESASGGRLMATASGMNGWEVFSFEAIVYS